MTLTAVSLAGVRWTEPRGVASFQTSRVWGVADERGRLLSFRGVQPSSWNTKAVAAEIAADLASPESLTWIEVLP